MSLKIGSTSIGSIYLGSTKISEAYLGNVKVYESAVDPYNPLGLELGTMRLKFTEGYTPTVGTISNILVDADENIWDCTGDANGNTGFPVLINNTNLIACIGANMRNSSSAFVTDLQNKFDGCTNLVSVSLGCTDHVENMNSMLNGATSLSYVCPLDVSSATDMRFMFQNCSVLASVSITGGGNCLYIANMFYHCTSLTSIPSTLDTSACLYLSSMFNGCTSLTSIPSTLDTSACLGMNYMFKDCVNVQSGALSLYQRASTQPNPPTHTKTFTNCGSNTQTGAQELAEIPSDWK